MPLLVKYNANVLGWQRKPGPLKVWSVVNGRKKTANGETPKFSIQEIPEDRYEDALTFMSTVMPIDEPLCKNLELFHDQVAIEDLQRIWSFCLQQGAAVAAFLIEPNNPKPVLAGVNMTWVLCAASEKVVKHDIKMNSPKLTVLTNFMSDLENEINVREFYKVDQYMSAFGLGVDRAFRGQGLANHLLKARDMMAQAYGIQATSTVFSGPAAQKAAANVGFEVLIQRNYLDIKDKEGNELFLGVPEKMCKLMGKRFS